MKTKIINLMSIIFVVILMSTGCSKFDADGYVQAVLDTNFKDETTQYIKITGDKQEEAEAIYNENVESLFTSFLSGITVSDDITKQGTAVFADIMRAAKYSVGEAKKDDDEYTVDITFNQMQIFAEAITEYTSQVEEYITELQKTATEGKSVPSDQEINDHVATILLDILQAKLDQGIEYADAKVLTVHLAKDSDNVYTIDEADYKQIISYAMDSGDVE